MHLCTRKNPLEEIMPIYSESVRRSMCETIEAAGYEYPRLAGQLRRLLAGQPLVQIVFEGGLVQDVHGLSKDGQFEVLDLDEAGFGCEDDLEEGVDELGEREWEDEPPRLPQVDPAISEKEELR